MRIDRKSLLKITKDTVAKRTRGQFSLSGVYLCGSLLQEDFLLGGTADIDLVFIHLDQPALKREIVRLTDEVHLDIAHHSQDDYQHPHNLRIHPWLGHTLFECQPLHDPRHFLDFTQASVRGQFYRTDYILERARPQFEHARQIWLSLNAGSASPGVKEVDNYLRSVGHAANALALLNGAPLTERRFLLQFSQRAEALGRPGLFPGLLGLLGGQQVDPDLLKEWLPAWQETMEALPPDETPARLHPDRHAYYRRAFEAILASDQPQALLWPLLTTWTLAARSLRKKSPAASGWRTACQRLGLLGEDFAGRVAALDAFIDTAEDALQDWAENSGA